MQATRLLICDTCCIQHGFEEGPCHTPPLRAASGSSCVFTTTTTASSSNGSSPGRAVSIFATGTIYVDPQGLRSAAYCNRARKLID